jgi:hypothetical protein
VSTELTEGSERAAPGLGDAGRTGLPRRFWRWCGRHPRAVWAAGLALAALVLFLLYLSDAQTVRAAAFAGAPFIMLRFVPFPGVAERLRFLIA